MASLVALVSAAVLLLLTCDVVSLPSPQAIGSDLSILTHNDLYGNSSTRQAATIVLSARGSNAEARSRCEALQETLWNPGNLTGLDFLRYLDYEEATDKVGQYWVGSSSSTCRAITTRGETRTLACDTRLPALCSQSAPLSSTSNAHLRWQTSIRTGGATIQGYRDKLSFRFLGLKYASYPSRFTYSTYIGPRGNISALAYGPGCIQEACNSPTCSEECLYLNIWTPHIPSNPRSPKKAVMVWIHGGGFTSGYGSDTTFDGGNMASRGDVVVVTINYRLSTLGFLTIDNSTARGNYWLSDQVAALEWVQNHIEDFGGDRKRVTVFGQSAGAASVRALLASPRAKGLFSRAILQSTPGGAGYAKPFSEYQSIEDAATETMAILGEKGCTQADVAGQLACLRTLDAAKLLTGTIASYPVIDGTYLSTSELLLNGTGPPLNVALMTGVMRDDGSPLSSFPKSLNASQELIDQGYDANAILGSGRFPFPQTGNTTLDIFNLTARVATDAQFRCLTQSTAFSAAKNRVFPMVYSYEIDRALQLTEWSPNPPTCEAPRTPEHPLGDASLPYWKCHSGELYYVFGTAIRQGRQPHDQDDIPFSQYLLDSWTAFGRTMNPNPEAGFLRARGFTNTSAIVERSTPWKLMSASQWKLRVLDVQPRDEGFRELEQCEVLGLPLDYYSDPSRG